MTNHWTFMRNKRDKCLNRLRVFWYVNAEFLCFVLFLSVLDRRWINACIFVCWLYHQYWLSHLIVCFKWGGLTPYSRCHWLTCWIVGITSLGLQQCSCHPVDRDIIWQDSCNSSFKFSFCKSFNSLSNLHFCGLLNSQLKVNQVLMN